jgi:pilus assembly protein Flp/PilA
MSKLIEMARQFHDDENGAAMVEYSILIGIIAGAAILAIVAIGGWVSGRFTGLCGILDGKGLTATAGTSGTCKATTGTGT